MLHAALTQWLNMVFNADVLIRNAAKSMSEDRKLITDLGGPTKVAKRLGYLKPGGVQRVQNWMARGIPAKVRLENPDVFPFPAVRVDAGRRIDDPDHDPPPSRANLIACGHSG